MEHLKKGIALTVIMLLSVLILALPAVLGSLINITFLVIGLIIGFILTIAFISYLSDLDVLDKYI